MEIGGGADEEEDDEEERLEVEERGLRGREAHAVSLEVYLGGWAATCHGCSFVEEKRMTLWRVACVRDRGEL